MGRFRGECVDNRYPVLDTAYALICKNLVESKDVQTAPRHVGGAWVSPSPKRKLPIQIFTEFNPVPIFCEIAT